MEKEKNIDFVQKKPMISLLKYIIPHWKLFSWSCFASIFNKILDLMPPILVGWVIDSLRREPPLWISNFLGTIDPWNMAIFLAILGVAIFLVESLFQWAYQYGFMNLAQSVQHQLRTDTYNHLQTREIQFFENHRMGETMAMLNDDVNQIERFLNIGFNEILQLIVLFIFAGTMMFGVSWELAVVGLLPLPVIIWGSLFYQNLISPRYQKVREAVGEISSRLENNIAGILVIKSFTAEKFESKRVLDASKNYQDANYNAIKLSSLYVPLIRIAIAIGFGGVLLLGSFWVLDNNGKLTVGELVFFSMMIQRILWPLTRMGVTLDEYERAKASARRTFGLLKTPSKIVNPQNPKKLPLLIKGEIKFENVSFSYSRGDEILKDLNFKVKPGEMIGIAGATGAGKSTLVKLLMRLYDPTFGKVLIDGLNLKEINLEEIRKKISLVSQDVYLFHGTIAENISYGLKQNNLKFVESASRSAQLHDFVMTLPQRYDTIVGERGILLSGGQRQRLSIARAILKDAPIMIFDEATSSVDTETEREIQTNLANITKGKTALVIAHRLSTIRKADRIIVLSNGKVSEEGNHNELVSRNSTYSYLWKIQSGEISDGINVHH